MNNVLELFEKIQDNRKNQGKRYNLKSILELVLTGYMHGYTSLARIYRFGKSLSNLQKRRLGFHTLITPSHPTITETMRRINAEEFQDAISSIIQLNLKGEFKQIAIDGKSLRSTHNSADRMLHLVSVYAVV